MNAARLSAAATLLLRAMVHRAGVTPDRMIVRRIRSVDWQSLTFIGERHEFSLAIVQPNAAAAAELLCDGLADAEWSLAGHLVADIAVVGQCVAGDGSVLIDFEALTLCD